MVALSPQHSLLARARVTARSGGRRAGVGVEVVDEEFEELFSLLQLSGCVRPCAILGH